MQAPNEIIPLTFRPPLDWQKLIAFYANHRVPDLEKTSNHSYERLFKTSGGLAKIRVFRESDEASEVMLQLTGVPASNRTEIVRRVRWMFDLDMNPEEVADAFASQPYLANLYEQWPGLRVAKGWDGFETAVATVLGQLVSVPFARVLLGELMEAYGEKFVDPIDGETRYLFPTAERLRTATLKEVRTTDARRAAIRTLAEIAYQNPTFFSSPQPEKELREKLGAIAGIGPWTTEYIAMRAFGDKDAFPATDYGLKQELALNKTLVVKSVRPLRAYAAVYLWQVFMARKERQNATLLQND